MGNLYIESTHKTSYKLCDVIGKLIKNGSVYQWKNNIPVADIPAGIYTLLVEGVAVKVVKW